MSPTDPHDPWASLAESLGALPANDAPRPPVARPQPPAPKPRQESLQPKPTATTGDWDSLASELGVPGGAAPPPPRPAARPAEPAPRVPSTPEQEFGTERRRDDGGSRAERPPRRFDEDRRPQRDDRPPQRDDRPPQRDDRALERDDRVLQRDAAGSAGDEPRGEVKSSTGESRDRDEDGAGGRRRRRGRRGGRGRGRRDDDRPVFSEGEAGAARPRAAESSELPPRRDDRDDRGPRREPVRQRDDEPRGRRDAQLAAGDESRTDDRRIDDRDDEAVGDERREAATSDRGDTDRGDNGDSESRPRRRRRRGRRTGRSRSSDAAAPRGDAAATDRPPRDVAPRGDAPRGEDTEEPLPTAYGMRPAGRAERPAESREGDEAGGRRRRRRGGEGRSRSDREPTGSRESTSSRPRSRGQKRPSSETRSSSFSRGRRDDFAPVAGRHEEDDEGLEFLGVEEAGQETSRRSRDPEDDDILVESGLTTVLDVPSWVEAIGIVIAGNLDARNKQGRGGEQRGR